MNSRSLFVQGVLFAFVLAIFPVATGGTAEAHRKPVNPVGLWFCTLEGEAYGQFNMLFSLNRDGTVTATSTVKYLGLDPQLEGTVSAPLLGVWKRQGHRKIATTTFAFQYAGVSADPPGVLQQTLRFPCLSTIYGNKLTGSCDTHVFPAFDVSNGFPNSPNPKTDEPIVRITDAFTYECDKLGVVMKE